MKPIPRLLALALLGAAAAFAQPAADDPGQWPVPTRTMRPWTRWWWLGSGVDAPNLRRMLEQLQQAGEGGVEICPIYGAKGYESRFIPYLTPQWMEMLRVSAETASRLHLGLDMTTGTGWPMGGPWVPTADASENAQLRAGADGHVNLLLRQPIQKVKRAAPGDEGNVVDPYSTAALDVFLSRFDQAFQGYSGPKPRAQFHDSFEYYGANWTPDLPAEFSRRRGYDLRDHLAALAGRGDPEEAARVREDYRRTIAELHLAWVAHWTEWSHRQGSLTREQAHGAPANIEDVYAAADIPETEGSFGGGSDIQVPMMKFASSAAHVTGRTLASSETFTWLGEHFSVPLASLKPIVDTFFLAGINHIFFHGTAYSPADVPWPGWLFYASVNFGPNGGIWHDLPAFNAYATRCQSILQGGQPDNEVLLYFPVADFWQRVGPLSASGRGPRDALVEQFSTPGVWMHGSAFHRLAMDLYHRGVGYDEVTDDLLDRPDIIRHYRAVVVPETRFMPDATLHRLAALAQEGITVVFEKGIPPDVPGWARLEARRAAARADRDALNSLPPVRVGTDVVGLLAESGIPRERMTDAGLQCVRRARSDGGTDYFIVNVSSAPFEGWVPLARTIPAAILLDPLTPDQSGQAALRSASGGTEVYLQLAPNGSIVLRSMQPGGAARPWTYARPAAGAREITGRWSVSFAEGGPVLPASYATDQLGPWTGRGDAEADRFAGTAIYRLEFDFAGSPDGAWRLDLGRVAESARVRINGHEAGILWTPPFTAQVGPWLKPGKNLLEVEVTNVAANRIRDLDRRHVPWKSFYEINFVDRNYQPFDASSWPVRPSGLLGPVRLIPEHTFSP